MKRKKIYFILLIILLTTGCWNYRELNDMSIVGAIGIDYDEEKKMFDISAQVFNAKKISTDSTSNAGGEQSPIIVYNKKAKTIHEALRNMTLESPKKLYIGHLDVVVLSESFAKNHLLDGTDFLLRDAESRKDFDVIIAKDNSAKEILNVLTPLEGIPSTSIFQTIRTNNQHKGMAVSVSYDEMLSTIYTDGIEAVLPVITIKGNSSKGETTKNINRTDPTTKITIEPMAVFKNNKMVGYLTKEESLGYTFINGKLKSSVISFLCDKNGNYGSVELLKSKSKVKTTLKNNKVSSTIEINAQASLSEYNCKTNLKNPNNMEKIKKKAEKKIKSIIKKTVIAAQKKYNSDIIGTGEQLYRNNYNYWKKVKKGWYNIFPNIKYKIKLNLKITTKGSIINSIKEGYNDKQKQ